MKENEIWRVLAFSFVFIMIFSSLSVGISISSPIQRHVNENIGSSLASSPWPMFHGNLRHTGLSPYKTGSNGGIFKPKWTFMTEGSVWSSPAIGKNGIIYVGSSDNYIYALYPDGAFKWRFNTGGGGRSSPAIGSDGTIYVGSDDHYIYAINPNGTLKWRFKTRGPVDSSPAIGGDGTIYVGSIDSYLYAINPNGTLKWKFKTGGGVWSSPAISSNGIIYVGSHDGSVYAINPDGTLQWDLPTAGSVDSSPAIGRNGMVYVGSDDGYFYAICTFTPSPPRDLHAIGGDRYIILTWQPPTNTGCTPIKGYKIYRGTNSGGKSYLTTVSSSTTRYKDTGLINGETYYYYVTAVSLAGESLHSNEVNATPRSVPSAPEDLEAKAGYGYVNLSWFAPADNGAKIIEYKIYRNGVLIATLPAGTLWHTWYNDTNVIGGKTYTYYVTAVNSLGESKPSNKVEATPTAMLKFSAVWIAIIAIIILAVIGSMIVVHRRKAKAKKT